MTSELELYDKLSGVVGDIRKDKTKEGFIGNCFFCDGLIRIDDKAKATILTEYTMLICNTCVREVLGE